MLILEILINYQILPLEITKLDKKIRKRNIDFF